MTGAGAAIGHLPLAKPCVRGYRVITELNGSWQDVAYTASHLAKHALEQASITDLAAADGLIAFKLIATATKII